MKAEEKIHKVLIDLEEAKKLRDQGKNWQSVGKKLGYSKCTISRYYKLQRDFGDDAVKERITNGYASIAINRAKNKKAGRPRQNFLHTEDFKYNSLWHLALGVNFGKQ